MDASGVVPGAQRAALDKRVLDIVRKLNGDVEPVLVRAWTSSHAALYCFRLETKPVDQQLIVLKHFGSPKEALAASAAMDRLTDFLAGASIPAATSVRPLVVDAPSSVIVMPYAAGQNLRDSLRRGEPDVIDTVIRAGAVLAMIHSRSHPPEGTTTGAFAVGRDDLVEAGRVSARSVVHRSLLAHAGDLVERRADYHPNNVVVRADGAFTLIDPSVDKEKEVCYFHHDLAYFLYKTHRCLVGPPRRASGLFHTLRDFTAYAEAFLHGYSSAYERPLVKEDLKTVEGYVWLYSRAGGARGRAQLQVTDAAIFGRLVRWQTRWACHASGR